MLEYAIDPPYLVKTIERPEIKRTRETSTVIKRTGEWNRSRIETKMTCGKCGASTNNTRTCKVRTFIIYIFPFLSAM